MRLIRRPPDRWRNLAQELGKFASIGAVNTVVNLAIFNLLLPIGPLKANVVATAVATTCSYFMNRHWTYRHLPKSSLRREYGLFFALNVVGLIIESMILFIARYGMHFDEHTDVLAFNIAKFGGLALGTAFRFWSYRRFVFGAHRPAVPDEEETARTSADGTVVGDAAR
ncbi:putative flippase GtrA [Stackebrandtia albiflava]|uniref:Putative flippase GtrA n=1 Tax=Stackebrandtia albiflava TaxID=406432 RepID=A0A562V4D8_9ACTN|nr:GtrA family protein [Stackebrandtia albiflava]TWJ12754.1 putative flippase GtrA [Stackebrandtia albiflava]